MGLEHKFVQWLIMIIVFFILIKLITKHVDMKKFKPFIDNLFKKKQDSSGAAQMGGKIVGRCSYCSSQLDTIIDEKGKVQFMSCKNCAEKKKETIKYY